MQFDTCQESLPHSNHMNVLLVIQSLLVFVPPTQRRKTFKYTQQEIKVQSEIVQLVMYSPAPQIFHIIVANNFKVKEFY